MRKQISFRKNSNNELTKGNEFDQENGYEAEYLGVMRFNDMDIMFTRVINAATPDSFATEVKINEVAYNTTTDGKTTVFYNLDKEKILKKLEFLMNTTEIQSRINSGMTIEEIFQELTLEFDKSLLTDKINSSFKEYDSLIYPTDYDYQMEMDEAFGKVDHKNRIAKIPMNTCTITGVHRNKFTLCSSHKLYSEEVYNKYI